jgi:hypothetical protein
MELTEKIAAPPPERQALLERELARRRAARSTADPAPPAGRRAPLTQGQQRLWTLAQLDPTSTAYHRVLGLAFAGPLDGAALHQVIARHDALRVRFGNDEDGPYQEIMPVPEVHAAAPDGAHRGGVVGETVVRRRWVVRVGFEGDFAPVRCSRSR